MLIQRIKPFFGAFHDQIVQLLEFCTCVLIFFDGLSYSDEHFALLLL